MWKVQNLCRFILFFPFLVTLIFLFIDGCSTIPSPRTYVAKGEAKVDFQDIDLVKYNSLLQMLLMNIKRDCIARDKKDFEAEFVGLYWLMTNSLATYRSMFPKATKESFLLSMGELYEGMKPYLDNEETK